MTYKPVERLRPPKSYRTSLFGIRLRIRILSLIDDPALMSALACCDS
jgi:hypothetical protein